MCFKTNEEATAIDMLLEILAALAIITKQTDITITQKFVTIIRGWRE